MVRVARKIDQKRIEDLKRKINDVRYLEEAINRLALTLTNEIVQRDGPRR